MSQLVSILIPAYNAEKWIGDTIRSASSQTWSRKEIIVVDDGSRDKTLEIARCFESRYVKVISQENRGASAARNKALIYAQGDYIQWLDADDILDGDKISVQMRCADVGLTCRTLFSSSFGTFYWRTQKAQFVPNALWQTLSPVEWLLRRFRDNLWLFPAAWLVSRHLTEKVGPWNENLSLDDDGEYFCRLVAASENVKFVPEARSYYRQSGSSQLSRTNTNKALESLLLSLTLCIGHLRSLEESDRTRSASLNLLQHLFTHLYYFTDSPALVERTMSLARALGGELEITRLEAKWRVLGSLLGWKAARTVISVEQRSRLLAKVYWDRLLYGIHRRDNSVT
jgi:glycosyltransferase involved in cell wall biosynthesis